MDALVYNTHSKKQAAIIISKSATGKSQFIKDFGSDKNEQKRKIILSHDSDDEMILYLQIQVSRMHLQPESHRYLADLQEAHSFVH